MAAKNRKETIKSTLWYEQATEDSPFVADVCRLRGYDVYGDMLANASWFDYLYLLFFDASPTKQQKKLLEAISIALANPGPRDPSVRAAMNGAVGGSGNAACLMAALAVGAGVAGGGRELLLAMSYWQRCGVQLERWFAVLRDPPQEERADVWPTPLNAPGFSPQGSHCPLRVRQTLDYFASLEVGSHLSWLQQQRRVLESTVDAPLSLLGVIAAAFTDLELKPEQGEMLYLLLRLPGAAAHAMEQRVFGWLSYPFWRDGLELTNDPGDRSNLVKEAVDEAAVVDEFVIE